MSAQTNVRLYNSRFSFRVTLFSVLFVLACTKIKEEVPSPPQNPQPDIFFVTEIYGTDKYLGMIINDPIDHKQYAGFGPKNEEGKMDTIIHIMENFPESDGWLSHEMDENFTPKQTTTSTGHTIEYVTIDRPSKTGHVRVKETSSGNVLWEDKHLPLPDNIYDQMDEAGKYIKSGNNKRKFGKADLLYLGGNMAGCLIGAASIGMGGPIAAAWGLYNTAQSCKSAAGALANMAEGNPAFGCMTAEDHANALSGFGEAFMYGGSLAGMAKSGLPGLIGYAGQAAGQDDCNDDGDEPPPLPELPPRDIGSIWGDPHIATLDGFFYDFHGYGEFIATRSVTDNFEVQVRLGNPYIQNPHTTYNTGIAVQTGSDIVSFFAKPQRLYINNVLQDMSFTNLSLTGNAGITRQTGEKGFQTLTIKHNRGDQVKIRFSSLSYFDYSVHLTEIRQDKVEGLLGNYDGNEYNDLRLQNGQTVTKKFSDLYPLFADNWRVEKAKSLFYYDAGHTTETYTRKDLPKAPVSITPQQYAQAEQVCRGAGVNKEPFLSGCIVDVATSNDPEVALSSLYEQDHSERYSFSPVDITTIELQGDAQYIDSAVRLTRNTSYISGQAFHTQKLHGDFETEFVFRMGLSNNGGADGLAFVIAKDIPVHTPNAYPGRVGKMGYEGVKASLAVEFDTWIDYNENSNHAAIHTNGTDANSTDNNFRIAYNKDIIPLEDGMYHKVKVRYKNKQISVWLDGELILEKGIDLVQTLGAQNGYYAGLTASTSSSSQAHYIHAWTIQPL